MSGQDIHRLHFKGANTLTRTVQHAVIGAVFGGGVVIGVWLLYRHWGASKREPGLWRRAVDYRRMRLRMPHRRSRLEPANEHSDPALDLEVNAVRGLPGDPVFGPEIRALLSMASLREARDRYAMSVLMAGLLSRRAHTIDVGAHSGAVLREMVDVAPEGWHVAYEPIPELAEALAEQFPSVTVRNAALSDENGHPTFIHVDSAPEYSGFRERDYPGVTDVVKHEITVRTEPLDDVLPEGFRPNLMKIDVEGAEMLVFRGALNTSGDSAQQ